MRTLQVLAGILCLCAGVKAEGEPCSDTAPVIPCGAGLYCDATTDPKTCKAILAADAECKTTIQCPSTQYCNAETPKKCADRPAASETCSDTIPCATGLFCQAGNTCADRLADGVACTAGKHEECLTASYCPTGASPVCTVRPAAAGECDDTTKPCAAGLYCNTVPTTAVCAARIAGGATCATDGPPCIETLYCDGNLKCSIPAGDTCAAASGAPCGRGLYCSAAPGNKCVKRKGGKEECAANMECLEDFTCDTTCKVSPGKDCSTADGSTPCSAGHTCQDGKCKANVGTSCGGAIECVTGNLCVFGSCIKTPAENGACDAISDPCDNGQQCVDSKCLAEVGRDKDCSSTKPCVVTDYCKESKCAMRPAANGDCSESIPCASTFYCKTLKCTAYATANQACTDTTCSPELYCQASDKKCMARPAVNEACAGTKPCLEGLKCVDSKCLVEVKAGFSCAHTTRICSTTDDLVCVSGMCKARAKAGETCSGDGECQADLKCEGGKCTSAGQSVIPSMWAVLVAFLVTFIGKTQL